MKHYFYLVLNTKTYESYYEHTWAKNVDDLKSHLCSEEKLVKSWQVIESEESKMKTFTADTSKNYDALSEMIECNNLSGTDFLDLFTDYFGLQLCSKDFMENLQDCEGYEFD